jgi:nitrogen fixation NifU-like protein
MPGLEDLYREIILDHYKNPRNRGELPPPAVRTEGHNPLCGDEIEVYLQVEDGVVADVRIGGQGCSISQSSASMMSAAVKGKKVDDVRALVSRFKNMMSIEEGEPDASPCASSARSWRGTPSPRVSTPPAPDLPHAGRARN